ncbi:MAG TPA: carboxypeptidase regulatory-like domain-containing protein [Pyrinomonadaceae bacterium]|nr:carboxypeptidase regulatory-like domain-containing protein [Pyrinomonadaceae bacterium]
MRFSTRYLFAILFASLSLPTLLSAQSVTQQPAKAPRGSVSGRVTIKEKGVAGVMVGLRKNETMPFEPIQKATTDPDGFYRITNVPPGNYDVVTAAPAYVAADKKDPRGRQILVGDDENVEGVNFALVRGGVITGRVTDADGRPVIQQQVNIYQENTSTPTPQQPQRPLFPVNTAQTDDRGIYRVYGLQAGRYKVAAGRGEDTFTGNSTGRFSYRQVFHPDVNEQEKAKAIEVSEGSEATDVDIVLGRALQTFAAAGKVVDEKGLPVPTIRFTLQRTAGQRVEFVNTLAVSNTQGDFVVEGLIPGKYGIYFFPNDNTNNLRAESSNFEIIDQDISGVVVKLTKGATVTGVVVVESEDKAVLAQLSELQIRGYIVAPGGGMVSSSSSSPIGPDGSFRLAGLGAGNLNLNIATVNRPFPPKGFSMVRIERDGAVVNRGIEIKDGEQVTGVRVVMSYGSATIRGIVTVDDGPLPPGARAAVRLSKPGETMPSVNLRSPVVDERGRFLLEGIPAGTYELITMVSIGNDPKIPARTAKRIVTVQDGSTQDITIAVEMPSTPPRP